MELKNISEKVINIGTTVVMPDKSITISEKQASLPSIKALAKQGYISVKKKSGTIGKEKQAEDVPTPPAESPEASGDFTGGAESPAEETADDKSAASKRGKNK